MADELKCQICSGPFAMKPEDDTLGTPCSRCQKWTCPSCISPRSNQLCYRCDGVVAAVGVRRRLVAASTALFMLIAAASCASPAKRIRPGFVIKSAGGSYRVNGGPARPTNAVDVYVRPSAVPATPTAGGR